MDSVSIIIPAYNQAHFVKQAIDSCLAQTHPRMQIVVINDGSTDGTGEVLSAYRHTTNIVLIHQDNAGLAAARNRGIAAADGTYLCFLDADDVLLPEKITKQVEVLAENPDIGMVYCDIVTIDDQNRPVDDDYSVGASRAVLSGDIFDSLVLGGYFPPHTVLIRKSVIDAVGPFDVALGGHADYELWLRVVAAGYRAHFVDERLVYYRRHPGQMSQDNTHMNQTLGGALKKIAQLYPERLASAIFGLQQCNTMLNEANNWLATRWDDVLKTAQQGIPMPANDGERYHLIAHFDSGQLILGEKDQAALWDATIDGVLAHAIFLSPRAQLTFSVPRGDPGALRGAVALHPDVWEQPTSGACTFTAIVDNQVALRITVDPKNKIEDRRWFVFDIPVPASSAGSHSVLLATEGVGGNEHRWALWRNPCFVFEADQTHDA